MASASGSAGGISSIKNRFESGNVQNDKPKETAPSKGISDIAKKFTPAPAPQPTPPSKIAAISKNYEGTKKPALGGNTAAVSKTFEVKPTKTQSLKKPVQWGTPPRKKPVYGRPGVSTTTGFSSVQHFNKPAAPAPAPSRKTSALAKKFQAPPPSSSTTAKPKSVPTATRTSTQTQPKRVAVPKTFLATTEGASKPASAPISPSARGNISEISKKFSQPQPVAVKAQPVTLVEDTKGGEHIDPAVQYDEPEPQVHTSEADSYKERGEYEEQAEVVNDEQAEVVNDEQANEDYRNDENAEEAQGEAQGEIVVDNEKSGEYPATQFTPERHFIGGIVEPAEEELELIDVFFANLNQDASVEELRGVEAIILNTSYTQVLLAPTREELETQISEYSETCKVAIYSLNETTFVGIAWQNNQEELTE